MKRLAVIPARGGSKRIPNKNIRDFAGKPMIGRILETAKASGLFERIHVSTESDLIADAAGALGFAPDFMRPAELADDETPMIPVVRFVMNEYAKRGIEFDQIWLVFACAPLVEVEDLVGAEAAFAAHPENALMAVSPYPVPVEWAYSLEPDGTMIPSNPGMFAKSSKDIAPQYFDAGAFSIYTPAAIQALEGGTDKGYRAYALPKSSAVDIDDQEDWALAEALFEYKRRKKTSSRD